MKAKAYLETSIVSCLAGLPSRDLAVRIAVATINRGDYLLTWSCTHIANAAIRGESEQASRGSGLQPPVTCTPGEPMEASLDV
jgi:hypothetical protein